MEDDIRSLIDEWFEKCKTVEDMTELYAFIYHEVKSKLKEKIDFFLKD